MTGLGRLQPILQLAVARVATLNFTYRTTAPKLAGVAPGNVR